MNTVLCSVEGLGGKDGKARVKNALNKVDGVQKIGVNLTTGSVEIRYDEPATAVQIKDCLEKSGYKILYE